MRILLFLLFCISISSCFGQKSNINVIDTQCLKQGYWVEHDSVDIEGYVVSKQIVSKGESSDSIEEIITKWEKIKHCGNYINGKKNGNWEVFKPNNKIWMRVFYTEGEITGPISIYFTTGAILYYAEKINDDYFEVKEYDKKGNLIKEKRLNKSFINALSETNLSAIGYNIE